MLERTLLFTLVPLAVMLGSIGYVAVASYRLRDPRPARSSRHAPAGSRRPFDARVRRAFRSGAAPDGLRRQKVDYTES